MHYIRCGRVNMTTEMFEFVWRNWHHTGKATGNLCELWKQKVGVFPKVGTLKAPALVYWKRSCLPTNVHSTACGAVSTWHIPVI